MGASEATEAPRVKLLAALLFSQTEALERSLDLLAQAFSPPEFRGAAHPFTATDYYEAEMGAGLSRCIVAFREPVNPATLVDAKWRAHGVEQALAVQGRRPVNVDVGYLDLFKVVLASFKGRGNKLYLERGVWADMILTYGKGRFQPLPWSFPDFASGAYDKELLQIRELYKGQMATSP